MTLANGKENGRSLSVGCLFSDRIEALLDGRVRVDGYDLSIAIVEAQRLFRSVLRDATYDVAELSMASHIAAVAAGRRDYVGLPVFPSRSFRHSNLYIRTDRGISAPEDLAGRTIGVIDFQQTAALWVRGILADDHGVARESVHWIAAGLHEPVLQDRAPATVALDIRLERSASTLDGLLRDGMLDAVISPTAPRCFADPGVPVARMWQDPASTERAWFARTGIFPIMHILVVRRSMAEADPLLAVTLTNAFDDARRLAAADLAHRDFPKVMVPWLASHAADTLAALGGNPWIYGIESNRLAIEMMLRHAMNDSGIVSHTLLPNDLFS